MSKQAVLTTLALLLAPVALSAAARRRAVSPDAQAFYAGRSGLHRRINGVLLQAQVSLHPKGKPTALRAGWTQEEIALPNEPRTGRA